MPLVQSPQCIRALLVAALRAPALGAHVLLVQVRQIVLQLLCRMDEQEHAARLELRQHARDVRKPL
jgi:hypothetical protein